jgi:retrograde regulation protein 2
LTKLGTNISLSNGIRFSISDLSPPRARLLKCIYRERAGISLYDALNSAPCAPGKAPNFPDEIIAKVSETVARFKSIADAYKVPAGQVTLFATEAMRKASNRDAMLKAIRENSGFDVKILAPEVETLFGSVGARSSFAEVNGLFLDLGGGSVQISYLNSATDGYEVAGARSGKSLPFGAARLIRILEEDKKKSQAASMDELHTGMKTAFHKLQQEFPSLKALTSDPHGDGIDIYLCGGGFRGYGSMLMHNDHVKPYPIPAIGSYSVKGSFFKDTATMRKVNSDFKGKIFGMSKRRREQFPAIATVVEALIGAVPNIRTVTFCSGGNREGALFMQLPRSVRQTGPLSLLHQPGDAMSDNVIKSVIKTITSAVPADFNISAIPTIFSLGLGPLFVGKIWARMGQPGESNAAYELHQAALHESDMPGFTHLARAVLGLTAFARWDANVHPVDQQLHASLRKLAHNTSREVVFWADYFGAIASVLATISPAAPGKADQLGKAIK